MDRTSSFDAGSLATLQQGDHVCAVYDSPEGQIRTISEYVRAGLNLGERCVYIVDDRTVDEVLGGLSAAAVDTGAARDSGRLLLTTKRDSYLQAGCFDPDGMIVTLAAMTDQAIRDGCHGLRVTGEMTWALGAEIGCDRLIEYETKLNRFFPGSRAHALCQYNRARFPPGIVRDVLRTHPIAVLGDQVCPNLYYEPPELLGLPEGDDRRVSYMIDQLLQARLREMELAKAVVLRDDFLSIASHELKTPMNALQLALAVSRKRGDTPGASLAKLENQVSRIATLVDRLLDVSRLNEGRLELELDSVDVAVVVRERVAAFTTAAETAGSKIRVRTAPVSARCDLFRLEQIIDNLLSNAIKYGEGHPIDVSAECINGRARVRVQDYGIGIPKEAQGEIFKRFVRLQPARTHGGFGLGLWIAHETATRMGGHILVSSEPGTGSEFTLDLPGDSVAAQATVH